MAKQKTKQNKKSFITSLQIHKKNFLKIILLHKYSYSYLGQLEFNSGAFILVVDVTTLWVKLTWGKLNWMSMIWKDTHVLIKVLMAENAYQSKNQALR